jgi:pimeloyl-ACP methyl ester carboxylesterase
MLDTIFVTAGGARLAMHAAGEGPPAILIHGYPLDHRMWLDLQASELAGARTLVAVDLRGHGRSPWAGDATHGMERFADDVAAQIASLGDGPADVVGLSMGGYVALALYERHPERVASLALVDTRAAADTEAARVAREASMAAAVDAGRSALARSMSERLLAAGADLMVRARVATMIESLPLETIVADLRGMRDRVDRRDLLARIAVPTLVVVGEADQITPPDEARAMAGAIPGARFALVPRAGHLVPMEAPATLVRELGSFW